MSDCRSVWWHHRITRPILTGCKQYLHSFLTNLLFLTNIFASFLSEYLSEPPHPITTNEDVIEDILIRLPIQSIVRCKLLSKRWQHHISQNPHFRRKVIETKTASPQFLGLFYTTDTVHFSPISTEATKLLPPPNDSLGFLGSSVRVVASSNNGFLLCTYKKRCYMVCNPITRQWVTLPEPNPTFCTLFHMLICDHSSCNSSQDSMHLVKYKAIRILWGTTPPNNNKRVQIEIFSSASSSSGWKVLHLSCDPGSFFQFICIDHVLTTIPVFLREEGEDVVFYFPSVAKNELLPNNVAIFYTARKHIQVIELPPRVSLSFGYGQSEGNALYVGRDYDNLQLWILDEERAVWHPKQKLVISTTQIQILFRDYVTDDDCSYNVTGVHPTNPHLIFLHFYRIHKLVMYDAKTSSMSMIFDCAAHGRNNFHLLNHCFVYDWPHWPPVFL